VEARHAPPKVDLYDLASDPGESENVIAAHPEIAEALERSITEIVCRGRTTPGRPQANDTGHWQDLTWITADQYERQEAQ
jgi:arylsulfatase A